MSTSCFNSPNVLQRAPAHAQHRVIRKVKDLSRASLWLHSRRPERPRGDRPGGLWLCQQDGAQTYRPDHGCKGAVIIVHQSRFTASWEVTSKLLISTVLGLRWMEQKGKEWREVTVNDPFAVCPTEDSIHCGWEGAEAAADGSWRGDEEQRLSIHRPVLRCPLPRGLTIFRHVRLGCCTVLPCFIGNRRGNRNRVWDVQKLTMTWENLTPALVFQGDCWICMELMSTSLDKFYKYVYCALDNVIPEEILGKITLAVSSDTLFF